MVKIIMHGCNGHMGQVISNIVEKDANAQIVAGIDIADQGKNSYPAVSYTHLYGAYVRNYDGNLVEISPDTTTFQPNLKEFEEKITPKTRAVIVNTPHNPTGVVYSEETIRKLTSILEAKQKEFGTVIYLISDEPYREPVSYTHLFHRCIICGDRREAEGRIGTVY